MRLDKIIAHRSARRREIPDLMLYAKGKERENKSVAKEEYRQPAAFV